MPSNERKSLDEMLRKTLKAYQSLPSKTDEERQRIAELEEELRRMQGKETQKQGVKLKAVKKTRFWVPWKSKEIIYADGKKVINCCSSGLEAVSNLLLSPHHDRVLFTAEEIAGGLRDIHVVRANGKNLVRITFKDEGSYLAKPGDLSWVGPAMFRYTAPRNTEQTFDFACWNEPHVLEVKLGSQNQVNGVAAYYYGSDGKLAMESFTEKQLEEKFSLFYSIVEAYVKQHKNFISMLDNAMRRARGKLSKAEEDYDKSTWKDNIEGLENQKEEAQGWLDGMSQIDSTAKTWPKIQENLCMLRAYKPHLEFITKTREDSLKRIIDIYLM
jgi:hypothetical protein